MLNHKRREFENEEAAKRAILEVDGKFLNNRKVSVERFIAHAEREKAEKEKFTKLFFKYVGDELSDNELKEMFIQIGEITLYKV